MSALALEEPRSFPRRGRRYDGATEGLPACPKVFERGCLKVQGLLTIEVRFKGLDRTHLFVMSEELEI